MRKKRWHVKKTMRFFTIHISPQAECRLIAPSPKAPIHKALSVRPRLTPEKRPVNMAKPEEVIPLDEDDFADFQNRLLGCRSYIFRGYFSRGICILSTGI